MAVSVSRLSTVLAALSLAVAILVAGYVGLTSENMRGEVGKTLDAVKRDVGALSDKVDELQSLLQLYARAAGIESPSQAEEIIRQRQEQQAKIEGARKESGLLRIYGSVDFADIKSLIDAFQAKYPFIKVTYEEMRPPEVYTRVTGELAANRPTADIVIVTHTTGIRLASEGRYMAYVSPESSVYPETLKEKNGLWTAFVLLPIVFAYNTQAVKTGEVPKNLKELTDSKWREKVIMHDITLGTTGTQWLVSLKQYLSESDWNAFVNGLLNLKPTLDIAVSAVAEKVASGEFYLGVITNLHDVVRLKLRGAPIEYFLPSEVPLLTTFSHIAIIKTTQNPNSAKLFVDYALSQEGQTIIGNVPVRFPARPGTPASFALEKIVSPTTKTVLYPSSEAIEKARQWADEFKRMGFGAG